MYKAMKIKDEVKRIDQARLKASEYLKENTILAQEHFNIKTKIQNLSKEDLDIEKKIREISIDELIIDKNIEDFEMEHYKIKKTLEYLELEDSKIITIYDSDDTNSEHNLIKRSILLEKREKFRQMTCELLEKLNKLLIDHKELLQKQKIFAQIHNQLLEQQSNIYETHGDLLRQEVEVLRKMEGNCEYIKKYNENEYKSLSKLDKQLGKYLK